MNWRYFKHSFRRLKAIPGFAAIAILSLALGIGVNATIFSVIYALILQPLPYKDADRIVTLWTRDARNKGNDHGGLSGGDFRDWKDSAQSFEQVALFTGNMQFTMTRAGYADRINTEAVTPEIFPLLGVQARVGRVFRADELPGGGCALLSYGFWQRRFGGDPAVLGKVVRISSEPRTIVGVMPPGFRLVDSSTDTDIWHSIDLTNPAWIQRPVRWISAMGKLKPGVTLEQAQQEMDSIANGLASKYPETNQNVGVLVETHRKSMSQFLGPVLYPLFGAVVFVLLIACTNVASLLLVRATTRRRELAIRAALGAGRRRLMSELVADGVTLGGIGALFGIAVAWAGLKLFVALSPFRFPGIDDVSLNPAVLSFLAITGLLTGILVGLAPAWQASAIDDYEALKEGSRSSAGTSRVSLRGVLATAEIALALMLLISAGLMIRTVRKMQGVELGFDPSHVTILSFDLSGERYSHPAPVHQSDYRLADPRVDQFIRQVVASVRQIPGVEGAAMTGSVPTGPGGRFNTSFEILGRTNPLNSPAFMASVNAGTPDFFKTLHIQLVKGRFFNEHDQENTPWTVVINETMARKFWQDRDPLGQTIRLTTMPEEQPRQIVGVVKDFRQFSRSSPIYPELYISFFQNPREVPGREQEMRFRPKLLVRSASPVNGVAAQVRKIVAAMDADQPVFDIVSMDDLLLHQGGFQRFYGRLLGTFAGIALLLAAIGVYGLMSYTVADRSHEIGIRMTIGAQPKQILWLMMSHALKLAVVGLAIGTAGALWASRLLGRFLYGVEPTDPVTFLSVGAILVGVVLIACYLPAVRATRLDPAITLRRE